MLWIMAAFTVVFGIGLMPLSVYGGVVSLVGAVLMVPPVANFIGRLVGKLWVPPIAGFLIATLAGPIVTFATALSLEEILERSAERAADREVMIEQRSSPDLGKAVVGCLPSLTFGNASPCYDSSHFGRAVLAHDHSRAHASYLL